MNGEGDGPVGPQRTSVWRFCRVYAFSYTFFSHGQIDLLNSEALESFESLKAFSGINIYRNVALQRSVCLSKDF